MTTALTWEVVDKGMCGVWLRGLGRMVLVPWGGVAKRLMDEIDEMNKMDKGWRDILILGSLCKNYKYTCLYTI